MFQFPLFLIEQKVFWNKAFTSKSMSLEIVIVYLRKGSAQKK
ncbi:hypothetical protein APA_327 [Pseudanabaena sp. lw0831]|nr:hypothetical protein APA_327 [Pseudanabaena sp. lw0831]